jgi:hypothetical protein
MHFLFFFIKRSDLLLSDLEFRTGWQWLVPVAKYGEPYRLARKLFSRGLRSGAVAQYHPMQQSKARILLTRLLEHPQEWEAHFEL